MCSLSPWFGGGAGFGQVESPAQRSLASAVPCGMTDSSKLAWRIYWPALPRSQKGRGASWVGHDNRRHWTSVAPSSPHSPDCAVGAFHHPGEEEVSSGMNTIFPSSRFSNARSVSPLEAWPRRCSPCLFRLASVHLLSYLLSPSPHSQRESRPPFLWTALLQTRPHRLVGPPFFFSLGADADNETTYAHGASSVSPYLSGSSLSWASG